MATWKEFAAAVPELAAFGAQRLTGRVTYLATLRSNGAPRVHPVTLHIGDGQLFVYMEPTSPKAHDLQRDCRYAIHNSVENTNGGEGEFAIRGQAKVVDDSKARTAFFEIATTEGFHPDNRYIFFEFSIENALATVYDGDQPKRNRWDASFVRNSHFLGA